MGSKWRTGLLLLALAVPAGALDVHIGLKYEAVSGTILEGHLYVPQSDGGWSDAPVQEEGEKGGLKQYSWSVAGDQAGPWKFFVLNTDANGEFSDWSANHWLDYVEVTVAVGDQTRSFKPTYGAGAVWYVCDILGEDGSIMKVNLIEPKSGALFGHVTEATSGLDLPGIQVQRKADQTTENDKTSSLGLFLFFPKEDSSVLRFSRLGYIPLEEKVPHPSLALPVLFDAHLTPELEENEYRIVLSWLHYPDDLDLNLEGSSPEGESFLVGEKARRSYKGWIRLDLTGRRGYGTETMTISKLAGAPYKITVKTPPEGSATDYRLSYSQAKVRIYKGKKMIKAFDIPTGQKGTSWQVCRLEQDGTVAEMNAVNP